MKRLLRVLFAFQIGVIVLFASCGNKPEKLTTDASFEEPTEEDLDPSVKVAQELKGVRYSQSKGDRLQWELVAESARLVENGPASLERVGITYFSDDGKVISLSADEGMYDDNTRDATVRGNVVVTSSDHRTLRTDLLKWNQQEEKLKGEGAVTITQGNTIIKGTGFEVVPAKETFTIFNVEGVIHQDDMRL